MLQRLKRTTKALFYGRNGISPNIDRYLNDLGDEFILYLVLMYLMDLVLTWRLVLSVLKEFWPKVPPLHLTLLVKCKHENSILRRINLNIILFYITLCYFILYYIILYHIILYYIILYYIMLYCVVLYCTILCHTKLYYIVLH